MTTKELRKQYRQWAGTDIGKDICDFEAYMQGCWKGRWTTKTEVRLFVSKSGDEGDENIIEVFKEGTFTAKDIYDIYLRRKDDIDKFADCDYTAPPTDIYDMLHLASSTNAYIGIFN